MTFYNFSSPFHSEYVNSDFRDFCSKTSGPSLLKRKDKDSIRVAARQHMVTDGGRRTRNRRKVKYGVRNVRNIVNDNVGYAVGMEPINRENE